MEEVSGQHNNKTIPPLRISSTVEAETSGRFTKTNHVLVARRYNFNNNDGHESLICLMNLIDYLSVLKKSSCLFLVVQFGACAVCYIRYCLCIVRENDDKCVVSLFYKVRLVSFILIFDYSVF